VSRAAANNCPLCGNHAKNHLRLSHTGVRKCLSPSCGLLFAFPQLDDVALGAAYQKFYYPDRVTGVAIYENTPEEILRQTFDRVELEFGPLAGKKLLDLGCGVGRLCQIAREYGVSVTGIEPDANAREKAFRIANVKAYSSFSALREAKPGARFDLVTMWDVIEHLREPWKDLEDLSSLLQPDGWLLLSTPNARCLRARLEGGRWVNMVNQTHFYYFTRKSLAAVLRRGGFAEIAELRFPIRYPGHARARRLLNRALVSCRLQGQFVFVARQQRLESAKGADASDEIRRIGVHATD
jgi:SAM-dependent methyltransferase